jgi:hypothetical protein
VRLERRRRQRPAGLAQDGQHLAHLLLGREAQGGEVPPDGLVLRAGQQHDLGPLDAATSAADLLVVGDGGGRAPRCTTKPRSGLSKPMPRALVATSTLIRLASRSSSAASRSASSVRPLYDAAAMPRLRRNDVSSSVAATVST